MCDICMPKAERDARARNRAINRLARERAKSLPANQLLGPDSEPFSEEALLAEMAREEEILKDCE